MKTSIRRTASLLALTFLSGSTLAAPPGVRYVRADAPPGGDGLSWATAYNDLRQALITAGSSGGAITELWAKEGTYFAGPAGSFFTTWNFTLVPGVGVYGGFAGTETLRDQRDFTAHPTILSGELSTTLYVDNVVIGAGNAGTVLDGFTITRGYADLDATTGTRFAGGGIHITGSPTIRNCLITGNAAGYVFDDFSSPPIIHKGGGVYCAPGSAAVLINCEISNNRIDFSMLSQQPAGQGAGLAADSCSVTLTNCRISGNTTGQGRWYTCGGGFPLGGAHGGDGGGIALVNASALLERCVIVDNKTGSADTPPTCARATAAGCNAGKGGGIYATGSTVLIVNSVLAGNTTGNGAQGGTWFSFPESFGDDGGDGGDGGAVWSAGGSVHLINCTLARNATGAGGPAGADTIDPVPVDGAAGIGAGVAGDASTLLENCIIWNGGVSELTGGLPVSYSDIQGGYAGAGNINADPLFIGGSDYRLSDISPCIDAGNSFPSAATLPATDADGLTRRVDIALIADTGIGAPVVDMGAYEAQNPCTVDLNGDGVVDFADYLEFPNLFDAGDLRVDFTGDGIVDFSDYLEFLNLFDAGC